MGNLSGREATARTGLKGNVPIAHFVPKVNQNDVVVKHYRRLNARKEPVN